MEEPLDFLSFPIIITILVFTFMVIKLLQKSPNSTKQLLPPGPWKLPIIGNLHQVASTPLLHRRLYELSLEHGPLMHVQLGGLSTVVVSSSEFAKEIMKTHDLNFSNRPFIFAAYVVVGGKDVAFAPYGEHWRQVKKLCILELLSTKRVQSYRSIREAEVLRLIRSIASSAGTTLNVYKILSTTTMRITSATAFGNVDRYHEAFMPFVSRLTEALGGFHVSDFFPSLNWLDEILPSKTKRLRRELDVVFREIFKEHREVKDKGENTMTADVESVDALVDVLLKHEEQSDTEYGLTTEAIQAILVEVFAAGIETSATTMEWAIAEMMKHPEVLQKAQAEVRQVFMGEGIEESKLHLLEYLKLIIKETFRLHPPLPLLVPRESQEHVVINGYEIPPKTRVVVNAWAIGKDPRCWNEPEKFYPERFIDCSVDYKGMNFELIPFGAGRRICPGIGFAIASVEFVLANLLYHFDWSLPDKKDVRELDMTEVFGLAVRRKNDLYLIPTLHTF